MEIMNESRNGCEISIFTDITPTALGEGRCFFLNDAGALGVGSSLKGQATFPKGCMGNPGGGVQTKEKCNICPSSKRNSVRAYKLQASD